MKKIRFSLFALSVLAVSTLQAQDQNNPWQIGFGVNAYDSRTPNNFGDSFKDFYGTKDVNVLPAISKLSVARYIGKGFTAEAEGSLNKVEKGFGVVGAEADSYSEADGAFWALNLQARYGLRHAFGKTEHGWFDPYLKAGVGYSNLGEIDDVKWLGGAGINFWFNENIGLNVQTGYHHSFNKTGSDYFQHAAGIVIKFGGKDTDGDGIMDKDDACIDQKGLKEFGGCPDTDGDGIMDKEDTCPEEAGLKELGGCPDTDGDGIADNKDECADEAGPAENNGCPYRDSDNDGVLDKDDKCINEAGPAENNGCPYRDSDNDGILDKDDLCPNTAGTKANKGCPEVTQEVQKQLNSYAKTILFDTGKATIQAVSAGVLDQIVSVLNEYKSATFTVEGHTDNTGNKTKNQTLSQERADAVKNYLVSRGIEPSRLTAKGFGQDKPIGSNATAKGRELNRRVEINLVK